MGLLRSLADFVSIEHAVGGDTLILTGVMEDIHGQEHIEVYDGEKMIHIPRKLHDDETQHIMELRSDPIWTILDGTLESPYVGDKPERLNLKSR